MPIKKELRHYDARHRAANRSHTAALKRDKSEWLEFK